MRLTPAEFKASCPLHRRNERTGCKRILRMANGTSEELVQVRLACQYWCSLALSVNRQRHHVRLPLDVVPLLEVVEQLVSTLDRQSPSRLTMSWTWWSGNSGLTLYLLANLACDSLRRVRIPTGPLSLTVWSDWCRFISDVHSAFIHRAHRQTRRHFG